jgi:hypothetical protein
VVPGIRRDSAHQALALLVDEIAATLRLGDLVAPAKSLPPVPGLKAGKLCLGGSALIP